MPSAKTSHVVGAAYEAWGHIRTLCTLSAMFVKARPIFFTLLVPKRMYERTVAELSRNFSPEEEAVKTRVQVIALDTLGTLTDPKFDLESVNASFADVFSKLMNFEPIKCAFSGEEVIPPEISPDAALLDVFGAPMLHAIRKHTNKYVKVYCWTTCDAASFHWLSGAFTVNKDLGLRKRIQEEADRTGRPFDDITKEYFRPSNGKIVTVPGITPMYDYEMRLQASSPYMTTHLYADFMLGLSELLNGADGAVFTAPLSYEPAETVKEYLKRYEETGSKPYWFGPLLPPGQAALKAELKQSSHATEICEFMDRIHQSHGAKSLVYLSFGSMFWPYESEKLWVFFNTLLEQRIPFLMSQASRFAVIPDEIREKVKASDLVYMASWCPQQTVLSHPAVGWFITHCGFNSITESIMAGVPMICWPYGADQPINSLHMVDNLKIAYELLAVRTGPEAARPIYRTGKPAPNTPEEVREEAIRVLKLAFGPDGETKRQNILKLREQFVAAWDDDGPSRRSFFEFLDTL